MLNARHRYDKIQLLRQHLSTSNLSIINNFDLVLTDTELEFRCKDVIEQNKFMTIRHKLQKIATRYLGVEVALYDSVYSTYPTNRVGVFLDKD